MKKDGKSFDSVLFAQQTDGRSFETGQYVHDFCQELEQQAADLANQMPNVQCASVCVYPARIVDAVDFISQYTENRRIGVVSVAGGFPSGQYKLPSKLLEVKMAVQDGATEVDIVISRAAALDGDWPTVFDEVQQMKFACGLKVQMKTILAVGELGTDENVYKASWASMLAGSDFIKTSTGKETINATLPFSFVICTAIKHFYDCTGIRIGFKVAGGIRTVVQALCYRCLVEKILGKDWLTPQLFRLGASSLLKDVEIRLNQLLNC